MTIHFIFLFTLLFLKSNCQWSCLECETLIQNFPKRMKTSWKKILGFELPRTSFQDKIFEIYSFQTPKSSEMTTHTSHTFIRNFKNKARVLVTTDVCLYSSKTRFNSDFHIIDASSNNFSFLPDKIKKEERLKEIEIIWEDTMNFLIQKKQLPNVLVVGVDVQIPAKLVKKLGMFVHKIDYLEELDFAHLDLFDLIILNPMKLCVKFSPNNVCSQQIHNLIKFRDRSIFKSIFIISQVHKSQNQNEDFPSFYRTKPKKKENYFFSKLFKFNMFFIEKFMTMLVELPTKISIMYEDKLALGNCLNNNFHFPHISNFKDIDDHFVFFQRMDFTEFEVNNLVSNVKSLKKDIIQCFHKIVNFQDFFTHD